MIPGIFGLAERALRGARSFASEEDEWIRNMALCLPCSPCRYRRRPLSSSLLFNTNTSADTMAMSLLKSLMVLGVLAGAVVASQPKCNSLECPDYTVVWRSEWMECCLSAYVL